MSIASNALQLVNIIEALMERTRKAHRSKREDVVDACTWTLQVHVLGDCLAGPSPPTFVPQPFATQSHANFPITNEVFSFIYGTVRSIRGGVGLGRLPHPVSPKCAAPRRELGPPCRMLLSVKTQRQHKDERRAPGRPLDRMVGSVLSGPYTHCKLGSKVKASRGVLGRWRASHDSTGAVG